MTADHVTVFATCVIDVLAPQLVDDTVAVLRRHGLRPTVVNGATCCGQPAANSGRLRDARRVARTTLRALRSTEGPIVVPSGSCATMIRHHWPSLFGGTRDEPTAISIAQRTFELTELLAARRLIGNAPTPTGQPVAYHASCHLSRQLGVTDAPRDALRAAGHTVLEPADGGRCCGFGGTFAVTLPDVSLAMADDKLDALGTLGPRTVTGCDLSCLAHLESRARERGDRLEFRHIASLL